MKLLKKFRKKESGEDVATQAARELDAALSAAQPSEMPAALVPSMPASHEESNGAAGADEDASAPIADFAPRPRPTRAKGGPSTATAAGTVKPAPRAKAATAKKAGTPAARTTKQATTEAATKPAATRARATATRKPRATSAKTSTARTTRSATTRKPAAKKG